MKLTGVVLLAVALLAGCGERNGQGTYTWTDGDTYAGEFRYGRLVK